MKLYLCLIIFLISVISVFAQVSEDKVLIAKTGADRMRDIKSLRVLVEKFTQEYVELGFNENKINSFVSEKLRDNNCLDPNVESYIYVNVNPIKIDDNTIAASVHISINRPIYYPAEDKIFITNATVWQTGSIITFPSDSVDYVYDILGKLMDKFIIEWYKSQIPYKEEIKSAPVNEIQEEPKKEGAVLDEQSLKKGQVAV